MGVRQKTLGVRGEAALGLGVGVESVVADYESALVFTDAPEIVGDDVRSAVEKLGHEVPA